jgi:hypothetical protein
MRLSGKGDVAVVSMHSWTSLQQQNIQKIIPEGDILIIKSRNEKTLSFDPKDISAGINYILVR